MKTQSTQVQKASGGSVHSCVHKSAMRLHLMYRSSLGIHEGSILGTSVDAGFHVKKTLKHLEAFKNSLLLMAKIADRQSISLSLFRA